jgi:hypothetical protein
MGRRWGGGGIKSIELLSIHISTASRVPPSIYIERDEEEFFLAFLLLRDFVRM